MKNELQVTVNTGEFTEMTDDELQNIDGGKNVFYQVGYYVGKGVYYLCEGWSHVYG